MYRGSHHWVPKHCGPKYWGPAYWLPNTGAPMLAARILGSQTLGPPIMGSGPNIGAFNVVWRWALNIGALGHRSGTSESNIL